MKVGDIIKSLRKTHKMTQADLARKLSVAPTAVSAWERNENRPLMDKLTVLAEIFNVPITRFFETEEYDLQPVKESDMVELPIVGKISCGAGEIAYQEIEGYEPTLNQWVQGGEYFYLRAKGDSMTGARIFEGDLLLIRKQEEIENGEIAAVLIGEEAYLKRVFRSNDTLILQSENPKYPPIVCPPAEAKIIGKLKTIIIKL
ncbi:LexA family protein [Paenibacillus brasilensis]|uniref:Repressor LexA n=1 Tax=Paenibacillus brasilensis TaxID=128574 RepID=A0ABU0KUF6_9BACL|nr:XRE family transcriptional regulator [Paenibacillus brasilensis]MDQ0491873.1 repressor LexA [Paenibacillus brasilensis]